MHDAEAIASARDFLETIACLAPAEDVCFRTFSDAAAARAAGAGLARRDGRRRRRLSSLTVRPGSAPGFDLRGAHATVTLAEAPGAARRAWA